jgi:hypothetical protein
VPALKTPASLLAIAITFTYFLLAARRVYGGEWISLALKYLAVLLVQIVVVLPVVIVAYLTFLGQALR